MGSWGNKGGNPNFSKEKGGESILVMLQ